jgi:hypothetical protein
MDLVLESGRTDGRLALPAEAEHGFRTDDYVMEMPPAGGDICYASNAVEFRDGRISRETRFYAAPLEPPQWRAQWVERT